MKLSTRPVLQRSQSGAALLTAMIIVTLIATLAASMVWQQWRAVQVEAAERARTQSTWILSGALDWARLILREDQRNDQRKGRVTDLTEPWAVPLAEARLSTFLAADKDNNTDDGGVEAFLSGSISDAQGRYNLNNLIDQNKIVTSEVDVLRALCSTLGIDTGVADRIAKGLLDANAGTTANAPLLPKMVSQLTWFGVDAASVAALEPYVVLLQSGIATPVNINTAPREVLSAVIKGNDVATSERILQVRQRTPFKSIEDFKKQFPTLDTTSAKLDVGSDWFEVRGRLRLADRILEERSLVQRLPALPFSKVWERQRVSSRESTGS